MKLRPLNDTVIIEPEGIEKYEGLIKLPDSNSIEKISPFASVVSYGPKCKHNFKIGQKIIISQFRDKPFNLIVNGTKQRIIKEHYISGVLE